MKCVVTVNGNVPESLSGPPAAYIGAFSHWLRGKGYASDWINHQIRLATYFSE